MAEQTETTEKTEKGSRTWSPQRRAAWAAARRRKTAASPASSKFDTELIAEDVIAEAVDNMVTLAGFAMPIAPYTAVTIAGVPGDVEGGWVVKSRAAMAGAILLEHAKRNPRILNVVARFNMMFKNVELVEVVGSVIAAGAVDAKLIPPDASIALPGGLEVPILAPAIGDTIEYIAMQQYGPEQAGVVLERGRRSQRDDTELSPAQRRQAAETRRRLAERDAQIGNGPDPTLRREGQTVITGGVEDT